MKRAFLFIGLLCAFALTPGGIGAATDDEVAARAAALEVAGAFGNDGYKLRDGAWMGKLEPGRPKLVQVNLYAGNDYWFTAAAVGKAKKIAVTVFDETGKVIECEAFEQGASAAAGFEPGVSGPYYVRVELVEGEASAFSLVYSYK